MIDIDSYRQRIGCYNVNARKRKHFVGDAVPNLQHDIDFCIKDSFKIISGYLIPGNVYFNTRDNVSLKLGSLYYVYFIMCVILLSSALLLSIDISRFSEWVPNLTLNPSFRLTSATTVHTRLAFFAIMSFILNKFVRGHSPLSKHEKLTAATVFFGNCTSRLRQLIAILLLFVLTLTFLMIAIINTSLLNPGPQSDLKVYYQNVQGLIPFSNLGNAHPVLDRSKFLEINLHIHSNNPEIVLLNETWLKKSIKDEEVIDNPAYKVFRKDRSILSHPMDKNTPKKYRKNGGGVLIAVRDDIEALSKRISLGNGAEILAIEVTVNGSKFVFCTCYRVGTLGPENHEIISKSLKTFYKSKKPKKIFIIGDFNLSSVSWPYDNDSPINNSTERLFVDTFNELGLTQCIAHPTHTKGKILDLLLTNDTQMISNVCVRGHNSICKSDHFPITFEIKTKIKRKKPTKRRCYNFKRADWDSLNEDLVNINWDAMLDSTEPELAWLLFKTKLFQCVDKHIPIITIKSEFQPPWFDSELYQACRSKEDARRKFKRTNSHLDEINFSNARREFKALSNKKMRENMYNSDDPALITKKFWSHVKFVNNSHRIPECMYLKDTYRNSSLDKANLFNKFFCDQFSESSDYKIDFDY